MPQLRPSYCHRFPRSPAISHSIRREFDLGETLHREEQAPSCSHEDCARLRLGRAGTFTYHGCVLAQHSRTFPSICFTPKLHFLILLLIIILTLSNGKNPR